MKLIFLGAVLCAAPFTYSMHVSSEDEKPQKKKSQSVEMKNLASPSIRARQKPPPQSSSDSDDTQTEIKPFCFGNLNKKSGSLYAHMYTLASVDTDTQEKPK